MATLMAADLQAVQTGSKAKKPKKEELGLDIKTAIAAVDEAAKKLPEIEVDLMNDGGFGQGGGAETEPPKAGSKVILELFSSKEKPSCRERMCFISSHTPLFHLICIRDHLQSPHLERTDGPTIFCGGTILEYLLLLLCPSCYQNQASKEKQECKGMGQECL